MQVHDVHSTGALPRKYKLHECYNAQNELCGCRQPLTRKPWRKGALQMPQCRAHGHKPEQGCAELVDGMAARGQRGAVHQWPIQSELNRGRQGAKRDRYGKLTGRGGQYAAGADMHIDVVYIAQGQVALALEIDGTSHTDKRARAGDRKKDSAAARAGIDLRRVRLCDEDCCAELDEMCRMMSAP